MTARLFFKKKKKLFPAHSSLLLLRGILKDILEYEGTDFSRKERGTKSNAHQIILACMVVKLVNSTTNNGYWIIINKDWL